MTNLPSIKDKEHRCPDCKASYGKEKCIEASHIDNVGLLLAKHWEEKMEERKKYLATMKNIPELKDVREECERTIDNYFYAFTAVLQAFGLTTEDLKEGISLNYDEVKDEANNDKN